MQVKIYDIDETGNETLRSQCELRDCFPDDEDNFQHAWAELKRSGRVLVGGGAESLTLIMRTLAASRSRQLRSLVDGGR